MGDIGFDEDHLLESNTATCFKNDTLPADNAPIAICGMALRLPGGLTTPKELWQFLLSKQDARARVPMSRYDISKYASQSKKPGTIAAEFGYFLEDVDLECLDTSFFSLSRTELERLDPQQRLLLEITRECFESAGEVNWRGKKIGCYVGNFGDDWRDMNTRDNQDLGLYRVSGAADWALANRVSYEFDLHGPSMTIRTGCSSTLVALHEACQAIQRGDCCSALIGGANLILAPATTIAMFEQGALSPEGSCKTFDASADGYARGEAINMIFVKPLVDALADGNAIRAIIRSTASNSDGKTPGLATPSSAAHEDLIRQAYKAANILDIHKTAYVECHGTGTAVGDPLEAHAIGNVFRGEGVYIGSVKPNVGHSEGASGITSIIKTVLALENRTIPPNIKFNKPNPKIPFQEMKLSVAKDAVPWPDNRLERASVNSFGVGGANAHVVIDSAASYGITGVKTERPSCVAPQLLVYSANTQKSLQISVAEYQKYREQNRDSLSDIAYTLGRRREHLPFRTFSVVDPASYDSSRTIPMSTKAMDDVQLVMVYTGQGAQWPQMGYGLYETNEVFRRTINILDKVLRGLEDCPSWSIAEELAKPSETSRVHLPAYAQTLTTAVQVACTECFRALDLKPVKVVGHSSGEIAAAYAAGALSLDSAIKVAYYRGICTERYAPEGAMAAIGLGPEEVKSFLNDEVTVACENSPDAVTISGTKSGVQTVIDGVKAFNSDVLARKLRVEVPYHSSSMKVVADKYNELIKHDIDHQPLQIPFASSITGELMKKGEILRHSYWIDNLVLPVRFSSAIASIAEAQHSHLPCQFLEVGPHETLQAPLRQSVRDKLKLFLYTPTLVRNTNSGTSFLFAVGNLYARGLSVNFAAITPTGSVVVDLPRYPWDHEAKYWSESRLSASWRRPRYPHHDLLGLRVEESTTINPLWRNVFRFDQAPWVRDHKVHGNVIFPIAGYVAMAGEAAMQCSNNHTGYRVSQVAVQTAMLLKENEATEIVTTLKRRQWTTDLDSEWWEFVICSHNGLDWVKHCSGNVQVAEKAIPVIYERAEFLSYRKLATGRWYEQMNHVGLNYGPCFVGLREICASTISNEAMAKVSHKEETRASKYCVHPTALDKLLQLFGVANSRGRPRMFEQLALPTWIEKLEVFQARNELSMYASAEPSHPNAVSGSIVGNGEIKDAERIVVRIQGLKLSPLKDSLKDTSDRHASARLTWMPDIDMLDVANVSRSASEDSETDILQMDELVLLCSVDSEQEVRDVEVQQPHLDKYRQWLQYYINSRSNDMNSLYFADESRRKSRIYELVQNLAGTSLKARAQCVELVWRNCAAIMRGELEPLEVLTQDDNLTKVYNSSNNLDSSTFLELLAHQRPNMRIIEIGAGTGATTESILGGLKTAEGQTAFAKYTFTDISAGFFSAALQRFKAWPNVEFVPLDITRDPKEQGFEVGYYDLAVATNVLHATPSLVKALQNVRTLLKPGGWLLLQELTSHMKWSNFAMGILPGWWVGVDDGRTWEPYVNQDAWEHAMNEAGFNFQSCVLDAEPPYHGQAVMTARASKDELTSSTVCILSSGDSQLGSLVAAELNQRGLTVSRCTLNDPIPTQDVISILDLEGPYLHAADEEKFEALKAYMNGCNDQTILWLTPSAQIGCTDPLHAMSLGFTRTMRLELQLKIATCEIDELSSSWSLITALLKRLRGQNPADLSQADMEFAIQKGQVYIPRFHPISLTEELCNNDPPSPYKMLVPKQPGRLDTLSWQEYQPPPLGEEDVEVEIFAAGLNYSDLLLAMGVVEVYRRGLGVEFGGLVHRIGSKVTTVKPGDRVVGYAEPSLSTFARTRADYCAPIPEGLTFEEAASMPTVHATVIRSLIDVGRLQKGQSILIHSACGGVGISAIQLSSMIGATIFATVGNEDKARYLQKQFNIPRNRIFNSRDSSFRENILRETHGKGVDLVLNSLSGELLHASWDCVAPFGKMIEISLRDLQGKGKLAMELFEQNRSYCCVDLSKIAHYAPEILSVILKQTFDLCAEGHLKPIQPLHTFKASTIVDAFRYFQQGTHMGKIVVSMHPHTDLGKTLRARDEVVFDSESAFLLAGGMGGVGKSIASWMVENGARNLVLFSRNAGVSEADRDFLDSLQSQGCIIQCVRGSVVSKADVLTAMTASQKPLKGIIQLSMVLRDRGFRNMSFEDWRAVINPRVNGTWNLHNAAPNGLDFFVMLSSLSGLGGRPGQANYASANTFLDAFAQYRNKHGLPASVIDLNLVEDIGYVTQKPTEMQQLKDTGHFVVREQEVIDSVHLAILRSRQSIDMNNHKTNKFTSTSQIMLGVSSTLARTDSANRNDLSKGPRMAYYENLFDSTTGSSRSNTSDEVDSTIAIFLRKVSASGAQILLEPASASFLAVQIGRKLNHFLLRPSSNACDEDGNDGADVDVSSSLKDLGMDSLVAIEVRNWWRQTFKIDITILEMLDASSLGELGKICARGLASKISEEEEKFNQILKMKAL